MENTNLILHRGSRQVDRVALQFAPMPEATRSYQPVPHHVVIDTVESALTNEHGFKITKSTFGLSKDDARMFATFDLESPLANGVNLAIGIRNSHDKTFPMGFCAGNRVFVCDNLSFHSDLMIRRKHTRFGQQRFVEAIYEATGKLLPFVEAETKRIGFMKESPLTKVQADSLILGSYERELISTVDLPKVLAEWRKPSFADFTEQNLWSLFNCYTTALGQQAQRQPNVYATRTMKLQGYLLGETNNAHEIQIAQSL